MTSERKIPSVPSVTINASILPLVIAKPLTSPATRPSASDTPTPSRTVIQPAPRLETAAFITTIITPAIKAAIEPTERSMPPAIITKVAPMAMMPINDERVRTLKMFVGDKNAGLRSAPTMTSARSARSGPRVRKSKRGPPALVFALSLTLSSVASGGA